MKSGILVGESDSEGINHWLERLAGDDALRESLGRGAAGTIEENFGLMGQITKLEEIYFNAVSQRSCSSS
jgi:glycosyltransferase involved in cell wall biosynthesis